jgi:hypothetical protein
MILSLAIGLFNTNYVCLYGKVWLLFDEDDDNDGRKEGSKPIQQYGVIIITASLVGVVKIHLTWSWSQCSYRFIRLEHE